MKEIIAENNQFDQKKLLDLGVKLLIVFGSRIEGCARADSDYDIGVIFDRDMPSTPRRYGALYAMVQESLPGERIDLVDLNHAPYPLQYRAAMKGELLYEETASSFANFRERAMLLYFDFQPILKIHEEALGI